NGNAPPAGTTPPSTYDRNYIDVTYKAATGANLDYAYIQSGTTGITITGLVGSGGAAVGPVTITGAIPMITITGTNGNALTVPLLVDSTGAYYMDGSGNRVNVVTASSGVTQAQMYATAMADEGVTEFRYLLPAGDGFAPGTVQVTINAGAVKNADVTDSSGNTLTGASNPQIQSSFTVEGPTATVVNPGQGGTIDINLVADRNWIDITFDEPTDTAWTIDQSSITSLTSKFTLGGPGVGTLAIDLSQAAALVGETGPSGAPTSLTYRFWLTGEAAASGAITLTFLPDSWSYYLPSADTPTIGAVTISSTPGGSSGGGTAAPIAPTTITIKILDDGSGNVPAGYTLNPSSLNIATITFTLSNETGWAVAVNDSLQ
ncbi:MAG: hypothetical protein ACRDL8_17425, partial [Solirubrobacteraceae bacterium]